MQSDYINNWLVQIIENFDSKDKKLDNLVIVCGLRVIYSCLHDSNIAEKCFSEIKLDNLIGICREFLNRADKVNFKFAAMIVKKYFSMNYSM